MALLDVRLGLRPWNIWTGWFGMWTYLVADQLVLGIRFGWLGAPRQDAEPFILARGSISRRL